ncbi:uncharacterized protein PG986_003608 [Apiospora aurea]|uniref:Uncharacterized protein n=1 Tax=Apiospora aurea TaxID=335848 RepID=A0ABR1QS57_9PEZI
MDSNSDENLKKSKTSKEHVNTLLLPVATMAGKNNNDNNDNNDKGKKGDKPKRTLEDLEEEN